MRHLKSGSKLGRNPWHRRATLRNLVTNLFEHGRITTTLTRAKAARPVAEKMITLGKRDTLQSRRQAASYIMTPQVTQKLFSEIAPKFADRAGGYTRIIAAGIRVGDGAKVAILELVNYELRKKRRKRKRKRKSQSPKPRARTQSDVSSFTATTVGGGHQPTSNKHPILRAAPVPAYGAGRFFWGERIPVLPSIRTVR